MNIIALIAALLLIYYRPLADPDWLKKVYIPFSAFLEHTFNGGKNLHGIVAWIIGVLLPVFTIGFIYFYLIYSVNIALGILFGVLVLYLTLRFSQFGRRAEDIATALRNQNILEARTLLAEWEGEETSHYNVTQVASVCIETTFRRAHQGLFAPIFWFIFLGPAGALLYRLTHILKTQWSSQNRNENEFNMFSQKVFNWLDWLPAHFTAGGFAIVGDFEDAAYCWRTQAHTWPDQSLGIVLSSGAGALEVKLCETLPQRGILISRPELGVGDEADADYIQGAVGLIWRVLLMMVGMLLLLTFAHWLGH